MHIALQVMATAQALEKAAHRMFRPHGITPAQFNVLNLLSDQPAGMKASDLADALVVDRSNVTGLIKRMKKDDLILELENVHDRRQHVVGLTEKGRKLWKAAALDYERGLQAIDAAAPRAQRAAAEKVLQQITVGAVNLS